MITQIYTVRSPEEALAVAKAGADHLGTFPKSKMGAEGVDGLEMCKKICDALRGVATSVMITLDDTPEECIRQAVYCKPDIVHVCGDEYFATPEPVSYTHLDVYKRQELNTSDSSTGIKDAISGNAQIGIASRELKDTEAPDLIETKLAIDGIAVVVNNANTITALTTDGIRAIYTGETTKWSDAK